MSEPYLNDYIAAHPEWSDELRRLHEAIARPELQIAVKWGVPNYLFDDKIIVSIAAFKNHCALWFANGVFLKDEAGVLQNAQKDKTKAMRQWRIESREKVDYKIVRDYVTEAIENQRAGKELIPDRSEKKLVLPDELKAALTADPKLKAAFDALTPGRRREYADHISSAKRTETRVNRTEKAKPQILRGIGLNDKYR